MTKNEISRTIAEAVSGSHAALMSIVIEIRTVNAPEAARITTELLRAQAADTATDIVRDLYGADMDDAAEFVDDNYN